MTADHIAGVSLDWLRLREPADTAARSTELAGLLHIEDPATIWDLGSGTGSMGRWLAPLLPVKQHWILCDHDTELLHEAAIDMVSLETRRCDITRLTAADLTGASLITCSALLDLLTREEVEQLAAACAEASCPALLTLSVIGRVELSPAHPLDEHFQAAFNAHQRRLNGRRRLLGPDAVEAMVNAFTQRGVPVLLRPSPWRLDASRTNLLAEWFDGWVSAACEQRPHLAQLAPAYTSQRLARLAEGCFSVVVHHSDALAIVEPADPDPAIRSAP